MTWLAGVHALAASAVMTFDVNLGMRALLVGALSLHLWRTWPGSPVRVVRNANGFWAIPALGYSGLSLAPASQFGGWWVDLRLRATGRSVHVLLIRDQLDSASWRTLQAALREPRRPDGLH